MSVKLVMFTRSGERRDFELHAEKAIIGRISDCDIQIALGVVSRRHCELTVKGEKILVRDLGSSNGTYANNRRIQQAELVAGDTLTVGPVIFILVINGKPQEIKPIRTMIGKSNDTDKKAPAGQAVGNSGTRPSAKDSSGTGELNLDDSAELEIFGGSSAAGENPLAELEALSKRKRATP